MIRVRLTARMLAALATLCLDGPLGQRIEIAAKDGRSTELQFDEDEALEVMVAASFAVLDKHPEATALDQAAGRIEGAHSACTERVPIHVGGTLVEGPSRVPLGGGATRRGSPCDDSQRRRER